VRPPPPLGDGCHYDGRRAWGDRPRPPQCLRRSGVGWSPPLAPPRQPARPPPSRPAGWVARPAGWRRRRPAGACATCRRCRCGGCGGRRRCHSACPRTRGLGDGRPCLPTALGRGGFIRRPRRWPLTWQRVHGAGVGALRCPGRRLQGGRRGRATRPSPTDCPRLVDAALVRLLGVLRLLSGGEAAADDDRGGRGREAVP